MVFILFLEHYNIINSNPERVLLYVATGENPWLQ